MLLFICPPICPRKRSFCDSHRRSSARTSLPSKWDYKDSRRLALVSELSRLSHPFLRKVSFFFSSRNSGTSKSGSSFVLAVSYLAVLICW
jgi:hypothetical protein